VCSENSRQLSVTDKEYHRVCDECDTKMDNYTIQQNHEEVIQAQQEKIEAMNVNIVELDNQKQEQQAKFEQDQQKLEDELNDKTVKKQDLENQVKEMTYRISDLNAARQTLHDKMTE
jgi:chromosome segregation ATPase